MKRVLVLSLTAFFALAAVAVAAAKFTDVKPQEFDPNKTELVQAAWVDGIGCPTGAKTQDFEAAPTTFTAGGCPTGDAKDKHNQGLLLAKTGPTSNFASATAQLKNLKGATVEQLGFDIRKPAEDDPRGSHCSGGSPRFNVFTTGNPAPTFIGCSELVAEETGDGWVRLRYNGAPIASVEAIEIVADEGQDQNTGDQFGVSILDNIDVNGTLVGQGPKDSD